MSDIDDYFEADTLRIEVPVTFAVGAPITSLVGGTAEEVARKDGSPAAIPGIATIDPGGDQVTATWAPYSLSAGTYTVQVRASTNGFAKTLRSLKVTVQPSV